MSRVIASHWATTARAAVSVALALGLTACDTVDEVMSSSVTQPAPRSQRVGVVSVYGDEFQAVELRYLSQYDTWTSVAPEWGLDAYITALSRDAIEATNDTYVAVEYDRAALSRGYEALQPLSEIGSALVDTFSLGMSESPVRYFDVDAVELDLRAICRIKALDRMLLVSRGRHKMLAGSGLVRSDVEDDTRFFSLLDLTVFDCPGPRETDWHNARTANKVDKQVWANKLEKLSPEGRQMYESEIKALLRRGLEQAMTQTAALRTVGEEVAATDGLNALDYSANPDGAGAPTTPAE